MWYIIDGVVCLMVGYLVGFLMYRNNVKTLKANEDKFKAFIESKGFKWPF
jgi:hypothetical protein